MNTELVGALTRTAEMFGVCDAGLLARVALTHRAELQPELDIAEFVSDASALFQKYGANVTNDVINAANATGGPHDLESIAARI